VPKLVAVNDAGMRIGEDHPKARYTNREIELVLELRDQGQGYGTIARKMEMPKRTVRDICNGRIRCQPVAGFKPMRME
jgi:hypothetical protein